MALACGVHELSIAASVLDALHAEAAHHSGCRILRAGLRIGELAGIDPQSLRFCLETLAPEITFDLELSPWTRRCCACGQTFRVFDFRADCKDCPSSATENAGGEELDLTFVELEEP